MTSEREAYVYVQLPGTLETVPAALLRVQTLPDGFGAIAVSKLDPEDALAVLRDAWREMVAGAGQDHASSGMSLSTCV